jgi:hypothetical protein
MVNEMLVRCGDVVSANPGLKSLGNLDRLFMRVKGEMMEPPIECVPKSATDIRAISSKGETVEDD